MFQLKRTKRNPLLLAIAIVAIQSISVAMFVHSPIRSGHNNLQGSQVDPLDQNKAPMISSEIDTPWRYTNQGWQQASRWSSGAGFEPLRCFEQVHPFIWASNVLLAVIVVTIWASSEWELAQLFGRRE